MLGSGTSRKPIRLLAHPIYDPQNQNFIVGIPTHGIPHLLARCAGAGNFSTISPLTSITFQ